MFCKKDVIENFAKLILSPLTPVAFPLIKDVTAAFSNILLETFLPTLVPLTHFSLQILGKTNTGVFRISGFLVNPLWKEIFIAPWQLSKLYDMKLGPVTKLDNRNKTTLNKFDDYIMSANSDVIVIFRLTANLELFGSRIPDAWSIKLIFLLIITFYLTKAENRTKNL